jgi:hypothetical protein
MTPNHGFLGTGWEFPVRTDGTGDVRLSSGPTDIEQSIYLVLSTAKGERVMRPTFGCDIHEYAFETVDTTTRTLVETSVYEALVEWEPRIDVTDVTVSTERLGEGVLLVEVAYRVRQSNNEFNLVYPFYLTEGGE